MLCWIKHKPESRLPGEISITSDMQITPPLQQKAKRNWGASWWKWKRRVKKSGLKLYIQIIKIMAPGPTNSWQIDEETVRNFIFLGSKITTDGDFIYEIKRCLLFGRKVMTKVDSRDITLPTKVHLVNAMVFPVVICRCESWSIKKTEHWRINAFELWCWKDSWESLGLQRDTASQS